MVAYLRLLGCTSTCADSTRTTAAAQTYCPHQPKACPSAILLRPTFAAVMAPYAMSGSTTARRRRMLTQKHSHSWCAAGNDCCQRSGARLLPASISRLAGRSRGVLYTARQAVLLLQLILQALTALWGCRRGAGDCPQVGSRAVAVRLFQRRVLRHLQ